MSALKWCYACQTSKPEAEFPRNKSKRDGLASACRDCSKRINKEKYWRNRKKYLKQKRDWYLEHKEEVSQYNKEYQRTLKQEIVTAYGGKCACCGTTVFEWLSIDHIDGNGARHREELNDGQRRREKNGGSTNIYLWLKNNGFPKDNYRLLCFNCNCSRGFYGYCPCEELL